MIAEESGQPAELDAYPGDMDPGCGAGFGRFVVAHQPPLAHEPAEGALHHPTSWPHLKSLGRIRAFDHLHFQLGAQLFDPLRKRVAAVAAVHPQQAQPGAPAQDVLKQGLGANAFGRAGGGDPARPAPGPACPPADDACGL